MGQTVSNFFRLVRERQRGFAVGSAITFIFNALAIAIYGAGSILIARAIGPEQSGYLVWFISGTAAIALFSDILGIFYSNSYLIAKGEGDFDLPTIRGSVLAYGTLLGVVVGLIFGCLPVVRRLVFHGFNAPVWAILISLNILGLSIISQIRGLFLGGGSFILLGLLVLIKSAAYSFLGLGFIYLLGWHGGTQLAFAQLIATWISVLGFGLFIIARGIKRPAIPYLQACMYVGWRGAGTNFLSFLHQRIDQYLVNSFLGATAVGLYGVAVSLGELITQVPAMLGLVLYPNVASDKDQSGAARMTIKRTIYVMVIVALLMIPLFIFAPDFIRLLYGEEFLYSATLLRYFIPAILFLSGLLLVNQHIAGMGFPKVQLLAMAAALLINLGCNLFLLPRLGVKGAAIASSISYGFWLLFIGGYLFSKAYQRQLPAPPPAAPVILRRG